LAVEVDDRLAEYDRDMPEYVPIEQMPTDAPQEWVRLIEGLLRASVAFEQRLPELWSGEGRPVPYPAACRPQAWSAASAVVVARALDAI